MQILNIRAMHGPSVIAYFDIALTEHLYLYNLTLRERPDGTLRTYAPNACGKHVASFHPTLGQQISEAAAAVLNSGAANVTGL